MSFRDLEAKMLQRCVDAVKSHGVGARDQAEANVFALGAALLMRDHAEAAERLARASEAYFERRPADRVEASEVVRRQWVVGLPRFRAMLNRYLEDACAQA